MRNWICNLLAKMFWTCKKATKDTYDLGSVLSWWSQQQSRGVTFDSEGKETHCQNTFDCIVNRELRQKIAPFLQLFFPGRWLCYYCFWPYDLVEPHTTDVTASYGKFVLCESCWKHLKSYLGGGEIILRCYRESFDQHEASAYTWEELEQAVQRDLDLLWVRVPRSGSSLTVRHTLPSLNGGKND